MTGLIKCPEQLRGVALAVGRRSTWKTRLDTEHTEAGQGKALVGRTGPVRRFRQALRPAQGGERSRTTQGPEPVRLRSGPEPVEWPVEGPRRSEAAPPYPKTLALWSQINW